MKYYVRQTTSPLNPKEKSYHAFPVRLGIMGIDEFAKVISHSCTLTQVDIEAVLKSFVENLPQFLRMGFTVKLENFGSFRLNFRSNGHTDPEKVSAQDIKDVRIGFLASSKCKNEVTNGLTFEFSGITKEAEEKPAEPDGDDGIDF